MDWFSHYEIYYSEPQKIKCIITILPNNLTSAYTPKRTEIWSSKIYLYTHIHSIHNSHKVSAAQISINRCMDK
jgi:hypothetical protein